MYVRNAEYADLDAIMDVYQAAKKYMRASGNPHQWNGAYPSRDLLREDIDKGQAYVCVEDDRVCGVFAFIIGADPTYGIIDDGAWLNDEPYGTIHRIASDGTVKGIVPESVAFCRSKVRNLRVDTHHDNKTMQHILEREGFTRCGIIYLANGDPRIAYQMVAELS